MTPSRISCIIEMMMPTSALASCRTLGTDVPALPIQIDVVGEIAPPVLRGLRVLIVSLKQEREIEHRIGVGRYGSQCPTQTSDCRV